MILSRAIRVPYVVFLYGTDSWTKLGGLRGLALRNADRCIAISGHTANLAISANGLIGDRVELLTNCLDPGFEFATGTRSEDRISVLTVARITNFEPLKGQELVINALPRLLECFPSMVYDVVGDGDRRPLLEALSSRLGVQNSVCFHGVVSDKELVRLYSNARVFVMPSRVEGFGFVFAEAMAHGTPAIGGNRDAASEVIVDGVTGFVIDPDSADDLVERVSMLLWDRDLWQRMSDAAVRHARERFSYQSFRRSLAAILGLLERQARRS
jgi:phosphatidylinositol alpha-1,6-mannosyltransferase